jgi:hypothetical protein
MRKALKLIVPFMVMGTILTACVSSQAATSPIHTPAAGSQVITKPLVLQWPVASLGNRLSVNDQLGATMFNVNGWGAYSIGLGYKMPGGELCTTYGFVYKVGCFFPNGTMVLRATGPNGPTGPKEVFTAADVALVNALVKAGITPRMIAWVARAMKVRPRW